MSLFIGMPCYRGELRIETCAGICASMQAATSAGMPIEFRAQSNITLIELARNILTADFLASTHDHMLMVDDDIGFQWSDVQRLLVTEFDIVSGVYPYKNFSIAPTFRLRSGINCTTRKLVKDRIPVACESLPAGFLLVSRKAVEAIVAHLVKRGDEPYQYLGRSLPRAFRTYYCPDRRQTVGEDYAFCELARECGFELHSHFGVMLRHFGSHAYAFDELNLAMSNAAACSCIPAAASRR